MIRNTTNPSKQWIRRLKIALGECGGLYSLALWDSQGAFRNKLYLAGATPKTTAITIAEDCRMRGLLEVLGGTEALERRGYMDVLKTANNPKL